MLSWISFTTFIWSKAIVPWESLVVLSALLLVKTEKGVSLQFAISLSENFYLNTNNFLFDQRSSMKEVLSCLNTCICSWTWKHPAKKIIDAGYANNLVVLQITSETHWWSTPVKTTPMSSGKMKYLSVSGDNCWELGCHRYILAPGRTRCYLTNIPRSHFFPQWAPWSS